MGDTIPTSLGRYLILEEIGRGMMGAVYRATDPQLGRTVALKTVRLAFAVSARELEQFEKRFLTEALAAGQLSHPGIVIVHDVGRDNETNTLYIALEHLEGRTLEQLAEEPVEWRAALQLVARLAEALSHAHSRGIVHRDIKPSNIMVLPDGSPKIMDFGIAKLPASTLTLAGQFFGTPAYMSPEQAAGVPVDGRSDLFSLGGILYLLLTRKRAFPGNSIPAIVAGVQSREPERPSALVPHLPEALDYVVARALAKDPAYRYADGRLLAEDLEDLRAGREPRHRAGWVPPPVTDATVVAAATGRPPGAVAPVAAPSLPLSSAGPPPLPAALQAQRAPERAVTPAPSAGAVFARRAVAPRAPLRRRTVFAALGALATAGVLLGVWVGRHVSVETTVVEDGGDESRPDTAPPRREQNTPAPVPPPVASVPAADRPASPWSLLPGFAAPATLELALEHSLRSGTLRVWADEQLLLEEPLVSRVRKKVLVYKARRGALEKTLAVRPGEHAIRVRIDSGGDVMQSETKAVFESGVTRRLEIDASGLIKKRLSLNWVEPGR